MLPAFDPGTFPSRRGSLTHGSRGRSAPEVNMSSTVEGERGRGGEGERGRRIGREG